MSAVLWLLLLVAAPGQEAPPEGAAADEAPVDGTPPEPPEILVLSERRIVIARQELIATARDQGYTTEIRKDGRTLLRHDSPWRGDIVLFDDGRVEIKRQPIQFRPPFKRVTPASWLACIVVPLCIRPNGQLVSKRRFKGYEAEAWAAIAEDVQGWNETIADHGLDLKVADLPDRLEALWVFGVPLDEGAPRLETWEERRRALFDFWDTRTENEWGYAVREVVVRFVRAVVQTSEHPFDDAEVAALDAARRSSEHFRVTRPAP